MKLQPGLKAVHASFLNRSPLPTLDACLGELLREEQRLLTRGAMPHDNFTYDVVYVAYYSQIWKGRHMG